MPVVPCGRRVVISGILAGGTPGFRNALMAFLHPSRAPCNCDVFGSVFVSMHARLNLQHISCCNSHRADLSIATMRIFLGFCLVFLFCFCFCCVLCFCGFCLLVLCVFLCVVAIAHGQYLDCDGSLLSFDTPKEETMQDDAQFVQLTQNCVTTWREPRRRRTEKSFV